MPVFSTFTYSSRMFCLAFCTYLSCSQFKTNKQKSPHSLLTVGNYSILIQLVAKGREVETPNLPVVFVLQQQVCFLSKNLQRLLLELYITVYVIAFSFTQFMVLCTKKRAILFRRYVPHCFQ